MEDITILDKNVNENYRIVIKINPNVNPPRPIYDSEISMVLINRNNDENIHISNYHFNDGLSRLGGHTTTKTKTSRKFFLNLSEGVNPKEMSFQSLKDNFIQLCCEKIGDKYKEKLNEIMKQVKLT